MPAPPIFVAGTGRSGTSQLANVLGEHPLIHRIPIETHFLVDPGGFRDVADALTIRFDPFVGDDALRRLRELLTVRLPAKIDVDRGHSVPQAIGVERYRAAVGTLLSDIALRDDLCRARYFRDRRDLIAVLRRAVDAMFVGAATEAGKPTWCEKTPFNLLSMDFLWELVPEATIVHVTRHPVAVVASHLDQPWAPSTVEGVLAWLVPVYDRWLTWRASADLDSRRYVEVRAEDLAADWPGRRAALFERVGVDDVVTASTFRRSNLVHRDGQFDDATRTHIEDALGPIVAAMGYGGSMTAAQVSNAWR